MNWIVRYTQYSVAGTVIADGQIRVKNRPNRFVAQCSLEDYLKRKHPDAGKLIIHECATDSVSIFGDIFQWFK
jgi:hypothetical protein